MITHFKIVRDKMRLPVSFISIAWNAATPSHFSPARPLTSHTWPCRFVLSESQRYFYTTVDAYFYMVPQVLKA